MVEDRRLDVLYIFRPPIYESKSIEIVFSTIMEDVRKRLQIGEFIWKKESSFYKNAIRLRKIKANLYHITGDVAYVSIFLFDKKVVLTIHDIANYKQLKGIKKWLYGLLWIRIPIFMSKKVTVISDYVFTDIITHFRVNKKKISRIYNPLPEEYKYSPFQINSELPTILQIGTASTKNVENIIKAVRNLKCKLVIIGTLSPIQLQLLVKYNVTYENFIGISKKELLESYNKCDLVTFVSTSEGFGMPVIEAQAIGRPVITSRACSLPEVAGKGACFVDNPNNPEEIYEKIQLILTEESFRSSIIREGLENVKRFSSKVIAGVYINLYESMS
jgi:glycosyltransferase involved in cell wall biosynthesis